MVRQSEQSGGINSNSQSLLIWLDRWMEQNPWHPRFVPYLAYVTLLMPVAELRTYWPASYLLAYTMQCSVVAWLLWRYRKQLPELTLHFHWSSVLVGAFVAVAWIWIGREMMDLFPTRFTDQPTDGDMFKEMGVGVGWVALVLRLVGMSVLVPLFEELFVRSLLLRCFSSFKITMVGVVQIMMDIPVIGEWLMHTSMGYWADGNPPVQFGKQFHRTPLGALTFFGVVASTLLFTFGHGSRDWPAAVVCGVAYCLFLAATRNKGLGPVCWAHGITNLLLWVYTLGTNDWRFL